MAGEDEDFDVEAWNRRLADTSSDLDGRRPLRTRHLDPTDRSGARIRSDRSGGADDSDGLDDSDEPLVGQPAPELFGDPLAGSEAVVEQGFPGFEHGQWTVEGEIERFGAFGRGVARSRGWKRAVAVGLLVLLVAPLVLQLVQILSRLVP